MIAGCSSVMPSATPAAPGTPDASEAAAGPNGSTTLTVDLAGCEALEPCRAYAWIQRAGGVRSEEVKLFGWGSDEEGALPSTLEDGSYTVHFRFVVLTQAPSAEGSEWQTIAECQDEVRATGHYLAADFELAVSYRDAACTIEQRVSVADS